MTLLLAAVVVILSASLVAVAITAERGRRLRDEEITALVRERGSLAARVTALERQHAIQIGILDGLGEGLLAVDTFRRVVLANRRFLELFGADPDAAGKRLGEVVRIPAVFAGFERALGGEESVERFGIRSGMAERKIEMRALPIASDQIAAVAVFIDVTKIERLEQMRRNFIADFSHEVRTPLAGLRSAVETLDRVEQLSADEEAQLRRITARQLARLERLVDDVSELSQIESGDVAPAREPVDLRGLAEALREDFTERAAAKEIAIEVDGPATSVSADPLRMQQAFSNLIDNAIKYSPKGTTVHVGIVDGSTSATVRISDHGEGVPPEERENIFRRFYRIDQSRSQEIAGTGLGLAIAKHIVLQHGGSISVEDAAGGGAAFVVTLPKR